MPTWYEDAPAAGIRVEPCYDPNDVNCVAPASPTYDPALPLSATNYPEEMFYSAADSALITNIDETANCPGGGVNAAGAGLWGHMALEASYLNGTLIPGDQMVFGRIRITARNGSGLCPGAWYTFRTPYGPVTLQTNPNGDPQRAAGAIEGATASAGTFDVGCLPAPATPCDFNAALAAPVMQGLLRQATSAAPGYLGSGLGLDTIVGSPINFNQFEVVRWPAGVTPATPGFGVDCTDASCVTIGSTNQFSVAAKLARPIATSVGTLDFGGQNTGTISAAKTVALAINGGGALGQSPVTLDNVTITGPDAAAFQLDPGTTCANVSMVRDASCGISLRFAPATTGPLSATLNVFADGSATPTAMVALLGDGTTPVQAPAATVTPVDGNVVFGGVRVTQVSTVQNIVITNSGTAPLQALPSIAAGADAGNFSIITDTCTAAFVPAGASCTIGVQFIPAQARLYSALLNVDTNLPTGAITFALSANGTGGIAAVSPTNNTVNTFPDWYQDERGVRLGQCDDTANPLCIAAPLPNGTTQSFPTNYPDEWFYYIAQSAPLAVSDPACAAPEGSAFVEAGTEAAFLGAIAPNQGITFGRLRIIAHGGLCANSEYLFTHPYGRTIIVTDDKGFVKPTAGTTDVGCLGAPCDYSLALASPVSEGYMIQDVRPAGYVGDPLAPSTATGAPYTDPATGQPANHFVIQPIVDGVVGETIASTDQFAISGRLVGPMVVTPTSFDFGTVAVAGGTATQDFTFTNDGIAPVDVTAALMVGAHAADYSVLADGTTCAPVAPATSVNLAVGASCTVAVQFDPSTTGVRTAQLQLQHTGRNSPLAADLTGIGGAGAGLPAISSPLSTVSFTDLHTGLVSQSAEVVISNIGGQAPLIIGTTPRSGTNPGQFQVTNLCPGNNVARPGTVATGGTCIIKVRFAPTTAGAKNATLTVNSNAGPLVLNLTGIGSNDVVAQSATNTGAGFPLWFQDGNGVRLEQCLQNDGNCVLLGDATFNPALPVAWPSNYPLESFYSIVDSDLVNYVADASCGSAGGFALLRVATEAAFTTTTPTAGAQNWFNRIRVVANGLCANTTYNFVHPYGVSVFTTDGNGEIRARDGTVDNGNVTGSAPVSPGFLRWDPNVAPAAPAGYIGDARTPHKVVGSQHIPAGATEPANYFRIEKPNGAVVGQTDRFIVAGRTAGPVVSSLDSKDFGLVEVGRQSTIQNFVITNIGSTQVTGVSAALGGVNAALFTITGGTCGTTVLALNTDQSCTVNVRFNLLGQTAAAVGAKSATLTITHGGLRSPVTIPLQGQASSGLTPAMAVTPTSLAFATVNVSATSAAQTVTIRNSGTGALRLGAFAFTGTGASQYRVSATTCSTGATATSLAAGGSCTASVVFAPTSNGAKPATLVISATDAVTADGHVAVTIPNVNVALTGTGASPTVNVAATLTINGTAGRATSGRITVTNSGTANLNLVGAPALYYTVPGSTAVQTTVPALGFGALTQNCANVLPGRSCTITVPWTTAATLALNGRQTVNVVFTSNASNSNVTSAVAGTFQVAVTGVRTR